MLLIGDRFCTLLETINDTRMVIKAQDLDIPDREPVRCYREYLGYCLGTRLGLSIPKTRLLLHPRYGRISAQYFVKEAQSMSEIEQRTLVISSLGFRIILFDLLCGNHDRRLDNLLTAHGIVMPIDFNVAFSFNEPVKFIELNLLIMRWFGIEGALCLRPHDWKLLSLEIKRLEHLLDRRYLNRCLDEIDPLFLPTCERNWLFKHLTGRLQLLYPSLEYWWQTTITPLHKWIY